ncbi:MAG: DUF3299 domain-containing protein [Pirellulaceae bacterium]
MNNLTILFAVVMGGISASVQAQDQQPVTIDWQELAAERELFQDPLANLSEKQIEDLGFVLRVGRLIAEEKVSPTGRDAAEASQVRRELEGQGIDVEWVLVQRERIREIRHQQLQNHAASVANRLADLRIELTGFVLPITVRQELTTRFFLVPTASSCSHGSFPPSTRMVYVEYPNGIALENRATALTVTGTIEQKTTRETFAYPGNTIVAEAQYAITPTGIKVVEFSTKVDSDSEQK